MAVKQNISALRHVKDQEQCKKFVKENGLALQYVDIQTTELCHIAVNQNGLALKFVRGQTSDICEMAVKQNYHAFAYVKDVNALKVRFMYHNAKKNENIIH